ncbi:MAG: hypothetical protein GX926_00725 [Candidatus Magasanikbacteria bacterium]|jgi:hypothetical protein|nr:hypothetical protein [Candidatus Magasanikbacteria bacterium]
MTKIKIETPINSNNSQVKLRHNFEYHKFILWIALPKELRKPNTQVELSKHFGVGQDTLSEWKKRTGFWEEVARQRKEWSKEKTSDIIYALYKRIIETGNAAEVKLWFQLIENWSERFRTSIEEENPLTKLTDRELAELIKKQKDIFNKVD